MANKSHKQHTPEDIPFKPKQHFSLGIMYKVYHNPMLPNNVNKDACMGLVEVLPQGHPCAFYSSSFHYTEKLLVAINCWLLNKPWNNEQLLDLNKPKQRCLQQECTRWPFQTVLTFRARKLTWQHCP